MTFTEAKLKEIKHQIFFMTLQDSVDRRASLRFPAMTFYFILRTAE